MRSPCHWEGKIGRGRWPFKSRSVLMPVPPPLLTGPAFTHAHVVRGRVLQDAASVDTVMRIWLACSSSYQVNWLIHLHPQVAWRGQFSGTTISVFFVPGRRGPSQKIRFYFVGSIFVDFRRLDFCRGSRGSSVWNSDRFDRADRVYMYFWLSTPVRPLPLSQSGLLGAGRC